MPSFGEKWAKELHIAFAMDSGEKLNFLPLPCPWQKHGFFRRKVGERASHRFRQIHGGNLSFISPAV
ncbi:MAG: hypothetical protein ACI4QR_00540, partial [Eubacteriales bacterium]